jgi:ribosome-associated protein
MDNNTKTINSEILCDAIVKGIEELKGEGITVLDLRDVPSAVSDFFVICHANSDTQVKSIANSVTKETRNNISERPWHVEGLDNCEWVLLDYSNVVVHIFMKEKREFYSLEDLWADAVITKIEPAQ